MLAEAFSHDGIVCETRYAGRILDVQKLLRHETWDLHCEEPIFQEANR